MTTSRALPLDSVLKLIQEGMGWDRAKSLNWMYVTNPLLGGLRPIDFIIQGREKKLIKFIKQSLEENKR